VSRRTRAFVLAVLSARLSDAQAPPLPSTPPAPVAAPSAAPADYRIGAGDVLEITVFGNPDLSRSSTVQPGGTIHLPLLGEVPVVGLTPAEIQHKLTTLLERDYLVNPQVEVRVTEFQSQFAFVVGEVNTPGRKSLRGRTRLIDVIVEAGSFTPRASGEIVITRAEGTFENGEKTLRIRLDGGPAPTPQEEANLSVFLKNGDIITASPKTYVTVEGEINRPNRYVIDGELTVTGAVSLAGGLSRFGSSDVKVRRVDPQTGKTQIIQVDLKAVRKGKQPDLPLLPNDVVSVARRLF
jgi:polysaccharide export outer membrane protein